MQATSSRLTLKDLPTFILRHRLGILATVLVLALDQAAKLTVIRTIPVGQSWPRESFFQLTHATNFGSTLDLFSGHTIMLIAVSAIGIGALMALHWPRPKTDARTQITFGLMLAGATGNLIDRVVFGHVTDFIDMVPWFIFNVADVAILIGFFSFALDVPRETRRFFNNLEQ